MAEKATTELTTGASTPRSGDSSIIIPEALDSEALEEVAASAEKGIYVTKEEGDRVRIEALAFPGALPAEFAVYFYVSAGGLLLGLGLWNLLEYWRQPLIEATLTEKDYLRLQCAWLLLKAKQEAGDVGGWSYKLEATSGANPAAPVPLKLRPGVLHTSNI